MIVEIHGAGFWNKGAELMLHTAVRELGLRLPLFVPAIDPTYGPYHSRCGLALHQILPPRSHVGTPMFSERFFRQKIFAYIGGEKLLSILGMQLSLYGGVKLSDIRGFIDIAGFAYTDEWGARPTQDLALLTAYYKRKGIPVILLPQAFGPFYRKETRTAFKKVLKNSTLVFARDQQSYEYVLELSSEPDKIAKAPDITLFYPCTVPLVVGSESAQETNYACVVPNYRILDQGKQLWGDRYHSYLLQVIQGLLHRGVSVRIVVHDSTGEDLKLAQRLYEDVSSPAVTLIQEEDPIVLKQQIVGSLMVVGSRYHSLVAAFSQQVPAVAIGWSHKYDMLFHDFGFEKFVFSSPDAAAATLLQSVAELTDLAINNLYRQQIARHLQDMHMINRRMWSLVTDALVGRFTST